MKSTKNTNNLPLPRLEFLWSSEGPEKRVCEYFLVLPLQKYDIRTEDKNGDFVFDEWRCLLGVTEVSGSSSVVDNVVQTPFRDHVHMLNDCEALGGHLPMYAVFDKHVSIVRGKNYD